MPSGRESGRGAKKEISAGSLYSGPPSVNPGFFKGKRKAEQTNSGEGKGKQERQRRGEKKRREDDPLDSLPSGSVFTAAAPPSDSVVVRVVVFSSSRWFGGFRSVYLVGK